jgi:ATP-dependent DNA helicase RecG
LVCAPVLAVADARCLEPKWLKTRRLQLGNSKPTHRFVHVTDVHHKGDRAYLEAVVRRINALSPDFVCFTGDLIEEPRHLAEALELFAGIKSPLYGVPGNHDYWSKAPFEDIARCFAGTGGAWLLDQQRMTGDGKFSVIGATCLSAHQPPLPANPATRNILLIGGCFPSGFSFGRLCYERMTAAAPTRLLPPLSQPVNALAGVGPERGAQLARLEIHNIEDLLLHRPRRYEDRRHLRPIAQLELGEPATTRGTAVALGVKWYKKHTKSIFELILDDGTGRLHCRWWNLPFMEKYFAVGDEVIVFGKPAGLKPRTMDHPETEVVENGEEDFIHFNRLTPVYPLTEGLPQRWVRALIWRTLAKFEEQIPEPWPELHLADGVSNWPSHARAIRMLHFPETLADTELARRRLALDEFIDLQWQIQCRRRNFEAKARALPCRGDNHLIKPFLARLGFKLTEAQTKVLRELRRDLSGPHPMRRLLQGDVGSGKTVVAACCALMAAESGYHVALMAPTEVLAEQHFGNFTSWLGPLGVAVELRTGSRKTTDFQEVKSEVRSPKSEVRSQEPGIGSQHPASGAVQRPTLTIGTHALIEGGFTPNNLGLVIIDEQHKFGVAQREQLVRKGHYPHLLVMTATPIPRTLGLTLYGELDVSVIDEMPPGRGSIKTFVRAADKLPQVWAFIRGKLAEGRQAFVVYPRVEETGPDGVKAVTKEFENLQRTLTPFRVGLLHGRLRSKEKEDVMAAFRAREVQVLLATSLIEVGVDVPNATIMLVENAELFGLAQLHQLRGRIGRGAHDSYCILVAAAKSKEARMRLRVLEETTDGFRIAEADLKLRGPGELLGQQQSGIPRFRFGDLTADLELIQQARQLAAQLQGETAGAR